MTLGFQHRLVAFVGELAIDLEGLDADDRLATAASPATRRLFEASSSSTRWLIQVVEDGLTGLRAVEQAGVELGAELGAQTFLLVAQRLLELLRRDLDIADAGDVVAGAGIADVGLDAEKGEGQRDQRQKDLDDLLVVADCVEHERENPSDAFTTASPGLPERPNDTVVWRPPKAPAA
jgi:hypothetical protein